MSSRSLRTAFGAFHLTLGLVVLVQSVLTVVHGLHPQSGAPPDAHRALIGSIEGLGALLFLAGPTLRVGGTLMLATFAIALVAHGVAEEMGLLVFAAGTLFVMVHGAVWSRPQALA